MRVQPRAITSHSPSREDDGDYRSNHSSDQHYANFEMLGEKPLQREPRKLSKKERAYMIPKKGTPKAPARTKRTMAWRAKETRSESPAKLSKRNVAKVICGLPTRELPKHKSLTLEDSDSDDEGHKSAKSS